MDLDQKNVLVLGGAGGIGKAICVELMKRGIKKLAVIDVLDEVQGQKLFREILNFPFIYKKGTVMDEFVLEKCMEGIKKEMGGLDIVINSVGILDESDPKKMIQINYGGVVFSTLTAIKLMRKDTNGNKGGTVVNISSLAGLQGSFCLPIYSGTKHAVLGFTQAFNNPAFYEKTGIKFITICPGITRTPLVNHDSFLSRHQFPEMADEVKKILDMCSEQGPESVGKCVLMALNDDENGSVWRSENNRNEKIRLQEFERF